MNTSIFFICITAIVIVKIFQTYSIEKVKLNKTSKDKFIQIVERRNRELLQDIENLKSEKTKIEETLLKALIEIKGK